MSKSNKEKPTPKQYAEKVSIDTDFRVLRGSALRDPRTSRL